MGMITEDGVEVPEVSLEDLLNPTALYMWMRMLGMEDESIHNEPDPMPHA